MASVTFDGRSLMIDGRRLWLVSGTIAAAKIPADEWPDRLHAAVLAGLNTVLLPVFWARSEPRPGQFDFTADNDIRAFVREAARFGLHVVLRPGPYVDGNWDMGGLPSWLLGVEGATLRTPSGPFMEAVSRYIAAVADQVRDLQVTAAGEGGPIVLVENEHRWTCGDDEMAERYLGEIGRYLRESNLNVPTINANNLWQGVEGQIDGWVGDEDMLATVRQLAHVNPDQPRVIIGFGRDTQPRFGAGPAEPVDALDMQRRIAEALAGGGQVNLSEFCPGQGLGFWPGRATGGEFRTAAPNVPAAALLDEHGAPTPLFGPVRRLLTFASRFARVFASLENAPPALVLHPGGLPDGTPAGVTVTHATGSAGGVAFVFAQPDPKAKPGQRLVPLLLPDGSDLTVELGKQGVAWCLFGVHLGGRALLDYCGLSALAAQGRMLVLFGPGGGMGQLSINGTPLEVEVPKGRDPLVLDHEGITLVIVDEETVDETFVTPQAVYVGVESVTHAGEPVPGSRAGVRVLPGGQTEAIGGARGRSPGKLSLSAWSVLPAADYASGENPRFAAIDGPADLADLGSPHGYGWYRATLRTGAAKRHKLVAPRLADRGQILVNGQHAGLLGEGAGAADEVAVSLKKGDQTIVVLAENQGRTSRGSVLGEPKGLFGDLYDGAPVKLAKPQLIEADPVDPAPLGLAIMEYHPGTPTRPVRIAWTVTHRRKSPLFLKLGPCPARGLLLLNGEPVALAEHGAVLRLTLEEEQTKRGANEIAFAPLDEPTALDDAALTAALGSAMRLTEGTHPVTAKADWAFAKWEPPAPSAFEPAGKEHAGAGIPCWWRCTVELDPADAAAHPLRVNLEGMTKGQLYLNGRHVGRYFVATAAGEAVPPGLDVPLPTPWLREGENELLLFDEHGGDPTKIRLVPSKGPRPLRAAH